MGIISRSLIVFLCVIGVPLSLSAANGELTFAGNGTVTLGNNAELKVGGNLKVGLATSTSTVICKPASHPTTTRILLTVSGNTTIASGSVIHADGTGYAAHNGPVSPSDYTATTTTAYRGQSYTGTNSSGGGGSLGGGGGTGNAGGAGGLAYGVSPIAMGSGGGQGQGISGVYANGGAGGGAIQISVGGTLAIGGEIRANGLDGATVAGAGGGGGGGGSIVITTIGIAGSGCVKANGGNGGSNGGGGGSGGRVSITYFSGTLPPCITSTGGLGNGGGSNGADGSSSNQPQSPSNFAGTPGSTTILNWSWTDNSPNETGFVIHDAGHAQIGSVGANVTSWQEGGLSENVSYNRHVHAVISSTESNASNATSPYTLVHAPLAGDFTPSAISSWQIQIVVTAPPNGTAGQTGVRIEQSPDNNNFTILSDFSTTYTVTHQPLLDESTYYYRITFRNGDGVATALSPVNSAATQSVPIPVITTQNKKTNDTTPLVAGTSVEGFTVKVYEGTNLLGSTAVPAGGSWSLSTSQLPESPHVLIATATDPGANESGTSNSTTITIDVTPPAAPLELIATPLNGEIHLAWQANTESDLRGYNIYRKAPGEQTFTKINTQVVTATTYCDSGLTNGQQYEYKITAVDDTTIEE